MTSLDFFESCMLHLHSTSNKSQNKHPVVRITGQPGKHVTPGPLAIANDFLKAVPPTNGWMVELGYSKESSNVSSSYEDGSDLMVGYRIYISGDTLFVDELKEIPKRLEDKKVDLMLVHLGGTTIPGPHMPLIMVTMDAKQGLQLMKLIDPKLTIPIRFDDYDVLLSPLSDFQKEVEKAGYHDRVIYLDRGDLYRFIVKGDE